MTPPFISLAQVRALRVVVAWHEGIAIAKRCSEQIMSTSARAGLDTCAISVTGAVRVGGVSAEPFTHDSLFSLATALIDAQNAPAELLAVLSRADLRAPDKHEELMRELTIFSRPDPTVAIAAVAARALAKEAETPKENEFERLRAEAIAAPPKAAPARRQMPKRRVLMAAGGLGVIVAASAAVWATPWSSSSSAWPSAPLLEESSPLTAVTTTVERLIDRGLQTLGVAAAEPPAVETPAPAPAAGVERRRVARVTATKASNVGTEAERPDPARFVEAVSLVPATFASIEEEKPHRVDDGVYSVRDQEVEPPALAYPQLPSALSADDRLPGSYLELLVSESGRVERVRLQSPRSTLHERMLVSAAKAWRFRPAVRDGVPVKYVARIAVPR